MQHRGYAFELKPTPAQAATLGVWMGVVRCVYNLALEQRLVFWRHHRAQTGKYISWFSQSKELTDLRRDFDWIAAVPRGPQELALRALDHAYQGFFAGRADLPRFRSKGERDSLKFRANETAWRQLNAKWCDIRIPSLGWIKVRTPRPVSGRPLSYTIAHHAGRWRLSIGCEVADTQATPVGGAVGVDRGIAQTLTLSNGEVVQAPSMDALRLRLGRAQRALARGKKGSNRRAAQKARVAKIGARMARIRTDWCHRASTDLARRFSEVAIEDLKIANMTASRAGRGRAAKAGLNRSILDQCWGRFGAFLAYKLDERGGHLIRVPAAFTSQTCSACGVVDARSRKSQAVFECVHCDHADNADVNAAKEILRRSTAAMGAEGRYYCPAEPPIMAAA